MVICPDLVKVMVIGRISRTNREILLYGGPRGDYAKFEKSDDVRLELFDADGEVHSYKDVWFCGFSDHTMGFDEFNSGPSGPFVYRMDPDCRICLSPPPGYLDVD